MSGGCLRGLVSLAGPRAARSTVKASESREREEKNRRADQMGKGGGG